jgi:sigma-E factor negative regulatory protein RseA
MDGELDDVEAQRTLARLKNDPERRERWDSFHLIKDALRGERLSSPGFTQVFAQRLAAEPTVLAPQRKPGQARRITTYALSAAASLAAAAFVAWVAIAPQVPVGVQADASSSNVTQDLTAASAAMPVSLPLASVSSEGRMNEYLLAHQGFSPSTAFQGLAPYIRSVSATRPAQTGR